MFDSVGAERDQTSATWLGAGQPRHGAPGHPRAHCPTGPPPGRGEHMMNATENVRVTSPLKPYLVIIFHL